MIDDEQYPQVLPRSRNPTTGQSCGPGRAGVLSLHHCQVSVNRGTAKLSFNEERQGAREEESISMYTQVIFDS